MLDEVTADRVRALVAVGAVEAFDLDFKEALYGRSDADKRALAGDVAALANTAGGVIVLGIAEDNQARAVDAPGVEVSDAEVARMRQIVAAGVSPLPSFDIITVLDEPESGHGFLLVAVPRSVLAPHAVLVNESLRFPTRNGATTRYLSEPEVAAAYRARLTAAAARTDRLEQVESDLTDRLDLTEAPWIALSLLPELPGDFTISRASFSEFETSARNTVIVPLDGGGRSLRRMEVGHRRLRADDSMRADDPSPWGVAIELHTDGAGAAALRMYDIRQSVQPGSSDLHTLSDEGLAAAILWALQFLAQHARDRAHTAGTAAVRATILPSSSVKQTILGYYRGGFPNTTGRPIGTVPPVETYALVDDLAQGGPGLVAAAARLHHALGHAFGVPELPQLTLDGEMVWTFWNHERKPSVKTWAAANGVTITGLPDG
ncbi:AlbA family DNA-binding domain-containing protein [Cellulomonas hominis]